MGKCGDAQALSLFYAYITFSYSKYGRLAYYRGHQCFTNTSCYFRFYDREIRAYQILNGEVDRPEECQALYDVLQMHRERAQKAAIDMAKKQAIKQAEAGSERLRDKFNIPIPVCMHYTFISTLGGLDSQPYMSTFPDSAGGSRIFTQIFKTSRIHTIYRREASVSRDLKM